MNEEDVVKAHYVPLSSLRRAVKLLETPYREEDKRCKRNLVLLQTSRSMHEVELRQRKWRNIHQMALRNAIYGHRWNEVVYLLNKAPIWQHASNKGDELHIYIRALTILLMNHPSAKAQSLLDNYVHMVLGCRSNQDKKAVYKSILCLTKKTYGSSHSG